MKDKVSFEYLAGDWYELPVDKSLNQIFNDLEKEYEENNPSRKLIKQAVRDIASSRQNKMYAAIFPKESNEGTFAITKPKNIPWEAEPLIKSIAMARKHKRKAAYNELAEETLLNLGQSFSEVEELPDIRLRYIFMNSNIQEAIVKRHLPQVELRLKILQEYIEKDPKMWRLCTLRLMIASLDQLISLIEKAALPNDDHKAKDAMEAVSNLYDGLLAMRAPKRASKEDGGEESFEFSLNNSPDKETIIRELEVQFSKSWKLRSEVDKRNLEECYQRYSHCRLVEAQKDFDTDFEKAWKDYIDFRRYMTNPSVDDVRMHIRNELVEYCIAIIKDASKGYGVPSGYSTYKNRSIFDAFLNEIIINVHNNISCELNVLLNALSTSCTLFSFLIDTTRIDFALSKRIIVFCENTEQTVEKVGTEYQFKTKGKALLDGYHKAASSMFREILVEDRNLLITGEPSERSDICARLSKLIIRLDASCQIVAAGIVEEASEEVLDYYIAKQRVLDCAKKDN